MSESNHVFTIDNRVISYSVYEQALKDIEALNVENKLLKNQLCFTNSSWPHEKHLHKKIEQLQSDNEKLQSQVDVMRASLERIASIESLALRTKDLVYDADEALAKIAEINNK